MPGKPFIKKRRVIKRKPGSKSSGAYFTQDTQDSIVKYQEETEISKKQEIFVKEILPAYKELVENLINVYGFNVAYETKTDLKAECVEFLYQTTEKFDHTKGSKAFSYFNVVAKNFLTIKSKQNVKRVQNYISLDDSENISSNDMQIIESHNIVPSYEETLEKERFRQVVEDIVDAVEDRTKSENEKITVYAIKIILKNIDNLELFNKRAILLYIKQITGLSPKQLSISLSSLKKYYREVKGTEGYEF